MRRNRPVVVAVSLGFDPVHIGHPRLFEAAKRLGNELAMIFNKDNWLRKKKRLVFMPQAERIELIYFQRCERDQGVTKDATRYLCERRRPDQEEHFLCVCVREDRSRDGHSAWVGDVRCSRVSGCWKSSNINQYRDEGGI